MFQISFKNPNRISLDIDTTSLASLVDIPFSISILPSIHIKKIRRKMGRAVKCRNLDNHGPSKYFILRQRLKTRIKFGLPIDATTSKKSKPTPTWLSRLMFQIFKNYRIVIRLNIGYLISRLRNSFIRLNSTSRYLHPILIQPGFV